MTKLLFVTGGVVSWLGKWITAAAVGKLLQSAWYAVTIIKMDPYLNVDAGTMSPFRHGEVFVTDDGAETDLDLGHYERFLDIRLSHDNTLTSGKVYSRVLQKERDGWYLGDDIQVIPHVVNEVKDAILKVAEEYDITIVEIGGTIGDIEWPHFTEAARQLRRDLGKENVLFAHVVPIIYLWFSQEFKTKPIQHSHKEFTRLGLQEDLMFVRTPYALPEGITDKISLFCDMASDHIVTNPDCDSIYELPQIFLDQGVDKIIQDHFALPYRQPDITNRQEKTKNILHADQTVSVAMVGKYAELQDSYLSVVEALKHAWAYENIHVDLHTIEADEYHAGDLAEYDALLIPWWFGARGIDGKLLAIRDAREMQKPFLGICLWLQLAVIEFVRDVLGQSDVTSREFDPQSTSCIIDYMPWQSDDLSKGGTMRLGSYTAKLLPDTKIYHLYDEFDLIVDGTITERHRHRFEVNPDYYSQLEDSDLIIAARDQQTWLVEHIELHDHPYRVATQAHPEFLSRLEKPHPLFVGLVRAGENPII